MTDETTTTVQVGTPFYRAYTDRHRDIVHLVEYIVRKVTPTSRVRAILNREGFWSQQYAEGVWYPGKGVQQAEDPTVICAEPSWMHRRENPDEVYFDPNKNHPKYTRTLEAALCSLYRRQQRRLLLEIWKTGQTDQFLHALEQVLPSSVVEEGKRHIEYTLWGFKTRSLFYLGIRELLGEGDNRE